MTRSPFPFLAGLAATLLTGCATSALHDAPSRADQPWTPSVTSEGEIVPGRDRHHALSLPSGYALPADRTLPKRPPAPEIKPEHVYSLAELIDIAQSTNPKTRQAWNAARDAALATGIARSVYLPQLTASVVGGYSRTHFSKSQNNPGSYSGSGEVQAIGLQWLLFDFGKREASIEAARQTSLASNILFTAAHQKVVYDVATAFYLHAASSAHIELIERSLDNARAIEKAAIARQNHAHGTVVDVAQAKQIVAETQLRLVRAQGDVQDSWLSLTNAVGISPGTAFTTQDVSNRALSVSDVHLSDQMVKEAVSRRPDVLAAYATARASQNQVRAAKAEFLPKIFVTGNAAYATGHLALSGLPGIGANSSSLFNLSSNNFSSVILGGVTVPIFDGGLRAALVKQAEDQSDSARAALRDTQDRSVRQIVAAENGLHTSLSAYEAAKRAQSAAQTGFDAALAAYRHGQASLTQVQSLQNALFDARMARSDAYYAMLIAASSLAFATGSLSGAEAVPASAAP